MTRAWNPMSQQYEPPTLTPAEFLLARYDEEEAAARAATPGAWATQTMAPNLVYGNPDVGEFVASTGEPVAGDQRFIDDALHIARWNPARILAECAAKRRIIELHRDGDAELIAATQTWDPDHGLSSYCVRCQVEHDGEPWPCETLRLLALPYANHPHYREEWRP